MFVINTKPTFTRTVEVKVPKGSDFEIQTFKATFQVVEETEDAITVGDTVALNDMLRERIVSMADLEDADGKTITYSKAVRDQVLSLPYVRLALMATYNKAMFGEIAGN